MNKCNKCSMTNAEANKFCFSCGGNALSKPVCVKCKKELECHYEYCVNCGEKVGR